MAELYGDDRGFANLFDEAAPESAPYIAETTEQLFGEVWNRPGLSVRDRRLLAIGTIAANGRSDVAETQFVGALLNGELTTEQLGEVILHLAYYAGWPQAQAMHRAAKAAVARVSESSAQKSE
jgi:alkylhydroperoxidase/carboxymuconolactone decarboxylase family protein YurZ